MKTIQNPMRWLGLALACGTLTLAITSQAGKPVKPTSAPAFTAVSLGGLLPSDSLVIFNSVGYLNNAGQVVGQTCRPGFDHNYMQPYLLNPRDTNADGKPDTWFVDAVQNATGLPGADGQNDLIIGLGNLPGFTSGYASAINDVGVVVGRCSGSAIFIVVPQNGAWYQDANADGVNDLMYSLGSLSGALNWSAYNSQLSINNLGWVVGECSKTVGANTVYGGFLITPVEVSPGVWAWFQDDGTGANALMVDLDSFQPRAINDHGQMVGVWGGRATLRQPDGTLVDLGAGGIGSEGIEINNRGQIGVGIHVVDYTWRAGLLTPLDTNGDGTPDLWYRDLNGDGINDLIVDVGVVSGLGGSGISGLNDFGSVVGASYNSTGRYIGFKRVAFLWENGVLSTLSSLTGGTLEFGRPSAINNSRQIVSDGYILLPNR
jgi:hypothetical protein